MKNPKTFSVIILLSLLLPFSGIAQIKPDSTLYQIETIDGNEFVGIIIEQDSVKIVLETKSLGALNIPKSNIKEIIKIEGKQIIEGEFWFENPQASRYFWSPNGYGLKAGEGYYQNVWVLFNQFAVGVTDHFSLGGGVVPLFLFAGASTPVWFTPKFSIPVVEEKFNVGGGALIGTVLGEEEAGFGILYGITTFGSRDKNISIGLGYGYAGGSFANSPMININGMIRTGSKGYFLTENYYIPTGEDYLVLISIGGRRIIKRSGLDFGLFIPIASGMDTFVAIPWLGMTIPIGKARKQHTFNNRKI